MSLLTLRGDVRENRRICTSSSAGRCSNKLAAAAAAAAWFCAASAEEKGTAMWPPARGDKVRGVGTGEGDNARTDKGAGAPPPPPPPDDPSSSAGTAEPRAPKPPKDGLGVAARSNSVVPLLTNKEGLAAR